jgi:zinc transport system ATP-binding protein
MPLRGLAPAVELEGVRFGYPSGPAVFKHLNLAVARGEFVAIAGPNGGGKTTLLRLVLGLEHPARGEARLFGEPVTRFARRSGLGYLAQRSQLGLDAPATVREVVTAGRLPRAGLLGRLGREDRAQIDEAIGRVGLSKVADRPLARLSGGQQQRTFVAKALASEPELLVLDEPTAGVDVEAQETLAALLHRLHRELDVTILYVSHEFGAVEGFVERLILVRNGILFDGSPEELPGVWHDPSHPHV